MQFRSEQAASSHAETTVVEGKQRRHFRQKIHNLAYINIDYSNGGIIRNVSESGISIQVVTPIEEKQEVHLRFELLNPRTRVEARGRVAWTDNTGQAGLEFFAVTPRSRRQLREWLFTQVLGSASHAASAGAIFVGGDVEERPTESLLVPADAIAPIEPEIEPDEVEAGSNSPEWYPFPRSPGALATTIDALIISAAVLMFCVISLAMTHVFPAWPLGLALVGGATGIFTAVYWFLFVSWIGLTPGHHVAQLAGGVLEDTQESEPDETPRFR